MDRRLLVTGLLGLAGAAGIATVLPRQAAALTAVPPGSSVLSILPESEGPPDELDDGFQLAYHKKGHRRRRIRRWRRICKRHYHGNGFWHRHCRRRPHWIYIWFWI